MMYFHFKNKLFLFSILSFVVFLFILNYQTYASSCTVLKDKHFSFYERKMKELNIADPPYTVFNFSTEVSSDHDIIQDELEKKEKKAMRRFKYDLDEKRDRSSKMLDKLLSNAIDFF
ncbi:hypothetical protein PFBG_00939 [Plasmodium falciparum 7G8]|uniref:Uncharacterized protein n=4 Tax=Plasmodium falciparum TaxID=5833 RepID=A0A5K1K846_PLAF7|nr:conserved Plasmodium protein, unknown function [Plasmodium falciparum 3D7]ETW62990.1 hypothetical protein PFMC_00971 [Plasmodium falciparum CAMP/Malaysia]EUR77363.1 hypothetical protein PFBG_00939 [Plasmodium falciparum 7G8]KAF4328630.1 hypothetical protein CYL21_3401 [Plasmodium falciparum NF54]SOS76997.1 conserved Plasmodium protein, unknown function [Plasmodium sp. gorilla clade G1]PKC45650.1 hypothetical protein CK202_3314 [Plasmodium falciparum NF54]|eukprot:XP_002808679.1 conserved Plasmodium protein, unknown function [Plasmodium falciparum 3D7]